ncbi:MAG: DUF1963 domain-containing protein [Lawsonibacter sp.]|nr:DUF1963 domain-containing protein [Lawsonibacter sp.]
MSSQTPGPTDCKFGGDYYLPAGAKAPEMELLAQFNFAQIPNLDGFPKSGLLQFFLNTEEEVFDGFLDEGFAWRQDAGFFRVVYHSDILVDASTQESAVPERRCSLESITGGMSFQPVEEIATISLGEEGFLIDLGFEEIAGAVEAVFQVDEEMETEDSEDDEATEGYDLSNCPDADQFCRDFGNWGFKLGGHPALRQGEFRLDDAAFQDYTTLLFQYDLTVPNPEDGMDLEKDTFCFFMKPEDLRACRFDDILMVYHNCY